VDTAWISYDSEQGGMHTVPAGPPDEEERRNALRQYLRRGVTTAVAAKWRSQVDSARDLNELSMLADAEAQSSETGATPFIERLRAYQPGEAHTVLASVRLRQSRPEEGVQEIE